MDEGYGREKELGLKYNGWWGGGGIKHQSRKQDWGESTILNMNVLKVSSWKENGEKIKNAFLSKGGEGRGGGGLKFNLGRE